MQEAYLWWRQAAWLYLMIYGWIFHRCKVVGVKPELSLSMHMCSRFIISRVPNYHSLLSITCPIYYWNENNIHVDITVKWIKNRKEHNAYIGWLELGWSCVSGNVSMINKLSWLICLLWNKKWHIHAGPAQMSRRKYRKISNIRRTKSQNLNVSLLGMHVSLRNILKPRVEWRMKM